MIDRTRELLEELHACFNQPMMAAIIEAAAEAQAGLSIDEATPFLRGDVLREPICEVLFRVVKSQAADREIDDFMTVPRSRPE